MKKVLILRNDLLPLSETFVKAQATSLKRWQAALFGAKLTENSLDLSGLELFTCSDPLSNFFGKLIFRFVDFIPGLFNPYVSKIKRSKMNLIHVHFGTDLVKWWPVLKKMNVPIVVTLHGYDINTSKEVWKNGERRWQRSYPETLVEVASSGRVKFIAVSEAVKATAVAYGLPEKHIFVHYIGVDTGAFKPDVDRPIVKRPRQILYVGRMVEKKGAPLLIEAFDAVLKSVPDAELIMVGDGPLLDECRSLAARLGVPVLFAGSLPSSQVRDLFSHCRVFCLPSITAKSGDAEGLPIVILEAQACGVPVVTSARGGTTEGIVSGKTGFAFAERDVPALGEHLIALLSDDRLATDMSLAARDFAEKKFDLEKCSSRLEDIYDMVSGIRT